MSFHHGVVGPCRWACLIGGFSDDDAEGFLSHLRAAVANLEQGHMILDITHDVPMPSATRRKQITEIIGGAQNTHLLAAHALVVNSPVGRGALTAINWVVRPKFDEKIFGNPRDAVAWLVERNPMLDGDALLRDLARSVPGLSELKW